MTDIFTGSRLSPGDQFWTPCASLQEYMLYTHNYIMHTMQSFLSTVLPMHHLWEPLISYAQQLKAAAISLWLWKCITTPQEICMLVLHNLQVSSQILLIFLLQKWLVKNYAWWMFLSKSSLINIHHHHLQRTENFGLVQRIENENWAEQNQYFLWLYGSFWLFWNH